MIFVCIRTHEDEARMKNVFISGSHCISRLSPDVRQRLDEVIKRELTQPQMF
jgi:hypothetical protein